MLAATTAPAAPAAERPNIVFILADDLGYGDVRAFNPERSKIATPRLDRLAAEAMSFTDAHSASSVCTPTRYNFLTGRYAWRTRLQKGVLDGGNDAPLISPERLTLPGLLRKQGYATACIGKWHLGFESDLPLMSAEGRGIGYSGAPQGARIRGGPTERGFDYFWGCSNARTMASVIENDRVVEILPPVDMMPRLTQRTVDWIGEQAAGGTPRPFFLYVALTAPHAPIVPTAEWKGKSGLGLYGDFLMQTDAAVGQILDALDQHRLSANTLVVFTSDNGCAPQANVEKLTAAGHFASGPYRGYKTDIWEGGHRVPFIARWPGRIKAGTSNAATIGLGDVIATTAELLGVRLPSDAAPDSVSFLGALRGDANFRSRTSIVHHSQHGLFAIRAGDWKLVLGGGSGGYGKPSNEEAASAGLPEAQLYHLARDPAETTNLIGRHPEEAARLAMLLQEQIERGRSTPGPALQNDVVVTLPKATAALPR